MKYEVIIGIDPDVEKSGVAYLQVEERELRVTNFSFPDLLRFLRACNAVSVSGGMAFAVVIEAGWLNRSNWHFSPRDSRAKCAEIGRAAGRNHQTGILIAEMCEAIGIEYYLQKPLTKVWKGRDGKITHAELSAFTGIMGRTNQDGRDAALLAWTFAGLPIRLTNK